MMEKSDPSERPLAFNLVDRMINGAYHVARLWLLLFAFVLNVEYNIVKVRVLLGSFELSEGYRFTAVEDVRLVGSELHVVDEGAVQRAFVDDL